MSYVFKLNEVCLEKWSFDVMPWRLMLILVQYFRCFLLAQPRLLVPAISKWPCRCHDLIRRWTLLRRSRRQTLRAHLILDSVQDHYLRLQGRRHHHRPRSHCVG